MNTNNVQTLTKQQLLALNRPRGTTHFRASGGELKKPFVANVTELDTLDGVACALEFGKAAVTKGVIGEFKPLATTAAPAPAKPAKGKVAKPAAPAKAPKKPAAKRAVTEQPELPAMPSAAPVPPPVPAARRKPTGRAFPATFRGISRVELTRLEVAVLDAGVADVTKDAREALRKSSAANPVEVVWNLCDKHKDKRRKDVIELCVRAGVAFYTARTQYQLWKAAGRVQPGQKLGA